MVAVQEMLGSTTRSLLIRVANEIHDDSLSITWGFVARVGF
jgi:hypothetical protein